LIGKCPERFAGGGESKKGKEMKKRGYLGNKGREQKGREGTAGERRVRKGSEGLSCSLYPQSEMPACLFNSCLLFKFLLLMIAPCGLRGCKNRACFISLLEVVKRVPNQDLVCLVS